MDAQLIAHFQDRLQAFQEDIGADSLNLHEFTQNKISPLTGLPGRPILDLSKDSRALGVAREGMYEIGDTPHAIDSAGPSYQTRGVFPVTFDGKTLGILDARSVLKDYFSQDIVEKLAAFAAQLGAIWDAKNALAIRACEAAMERLKSSREIFDWCGIYVLSGERLRLSSFRGAPSPHMVIPKSEGICGAAVRENRTLNIADVKADPRYLSCDLRTRSELVVPIRNAGGAAIGEIDLDSHTANAFDDAAVKVVEELAGELVPAVLKLI